MTVIRVDASSLQYLPCFRKFWNRIVLCRNTEGVPVNDMEYGNAWHIFREILAKTKDEMKAIGTAAAYFKHQRNLGMMFKETKEYLNEEHLIKVCTRYINEFGKDKSWGKYEYLINPVDNSVLAEQTFSIPFFEKDDIKIYLQGTLDGLLLHSNSNLVFMEDDKTTSQWNIDPFLNGYALRPQLMFYRLCFELMSEMKGGEWFKEVLQRRLGGMISGIFLKKDTEDCVFKQSKVFMFEGHIEEMKMFLAQLCVRIHAGLKTPGFVPFPEGKFNDTCIGKYNYPCDYFGACLAPKLEIYEAIIGNMKTREYKPLSFRKSKYVND